MSVSENDLPVSWEERKALTLEAFEARLILSEERLAQSEDELKRARGRLRATWSVVLVGIFGALALGLSPRAQAQYGVTIASLDAQLKNAESTVSILTNKTKFMNVSGTTTQFVGTNVQIVSGGGSTGASVNGLGNLIIGYNQLRTFFGSTNVRTGSHNLVLGDAQNYSSYGGLIVGRSSTLSAAYASVSGGYGNTASGFLSCVSGGSFNTASGGAASVSAGDSNIASGDYASVSAGGVNTASGQYSSISGGDSNTASGNYASISGGRNLTTDVRYGWKAGNLSYP